MGNSTKIFYQKICFFLFKEGCKLKKNKWMNLLVWFNFFRYSYTNTEFHRIFRKHFCKDFCGIAHIFCKRIHLKKLNLCNLDNSNLIKNDFLCKYKNKIDGVITYMMKNNLIKNVFSKLYNTFFKNITFYTFIKLYYV